jgi:hypothetical protein
MVRLAPRTTVSPNVSSIWSGMSKERMTMVYLPRIALVVVALLALIVAVPEGASATSQVPFPATMAETFQGPFTCGPSGTHICFDLVGSGQATHLGKAGEASHVDVDLTSNPAPGPGCLGNNHTNTRMVTLTGANGDQITLGLTGRSCDTGATTGITGISRDTYVVTSGTGRYSGATGSGTDMVYINGPGGTSTTVFSGTLSTPGSL